MNKRARIQWIKITICLLSLLGMLFFGLLYPGQAQTNLAVSMGYQIHWTMKAGMPTARWLAGIAQNTHGKIYVVGGTQGGQNSLVTNEEYDPATDTWTSRANLPRALQGAAAVSKGDGKILAMGGRYWTIDPLGELSGWLYVNNVTEFDPVHNTWAAKANMPTPRFSTAAVKSANGKIYTFGGLNDNLSWYPGYAQNVVEEYNPDTDSWSSKKTMPTPRFLAAAVEAKNGKIYVIGGEGVPWGGSLNTVEEYDPVSDTWRSRASMPTARSGLSAIAATNGRIYAIGGKGDGHIMLNKVEEYDPVTNTWFSRQSMTTARWMGGAAVTDGDIVYVFGGNGDCCTDTPLNITEEGTTKSLLPTYLPFAFR